LGWFIGFLVAMDWFNKVYMMFSRCFGSKISWKWDFRWRNKGPRFFQSPQRADSMFRRRHTFFLNMSSASLNFFKKIKAHALYWARRYEAWFTRPGNTWPNSFFLFSGFLKIMHYLLIFLNKLLVYVLIILRLFLNDIECV